MAASKTYTFYFAGELFSHKHLLGNAYLAKEIFDQSNGQFIAVLPQDLELRSREPQDIRDNDILGLLQCDLALFNYDGPELDSGTVVEFMFAKFADIPAVILRTDFRSGGDQKGDPWNLMTSFYPRTETIVTPSILHTKKTDSFQNVEHDHSNVIETQFNLESQFSAIKSIANKVVEGFKKVLKEAPVLEKPDTEAVYRFLTKMPAYKDGEESARVRIEKALQQKLEKGLL